MTAVRDQIIEIVWSVTGGDCSIGVPPEIAKRVLAIPEIAGALAIAKALANAPR